VTLSGEFGPARDIVAGLEGHRNAVDRMAGSDGFVSPAMEQI
jgi:hypothetical protein